MSRAGTVSMHVAAELPSIGTTIGMARFFQSSDRQFLLAVNRKLAVPCLGLLSDRVG